MHNNIPHGYEVPVSGKYKCEWCGTISVIGIGTAADILLANREAEEARTKPTTRWFRAGAWFDQCPRCRDATGWTLLEEGERKLWWKFWK